LHFVRVWFDQRQFSPFTTPPRPANRHSQIRRPAARAIWAQVKFLTANVT